MTIMANILSNYWVDVIIILVAAVLLIVAYKAGHRDTVKKIILSLVVQAEKTLGSGTGELKYAMVIEAVYNKLPTVIRFLFTPKEIDNMIEEGVDKLKEILASGVTLDGYDDEQLKIDFDLFTDDKK